VLWRHLVIAALFGNALPYFLFATAQQQIDSGTAGILNATTPLWTLALAYAPGHERRLSAARISGLILGFLGTLLIFAPWQSGSGIASWGGVAGLIAATSYGIGYVYIDHYLARRGIDPVALSASQLLCATRLLLLVIPFAGTQQPRLRLDVLAAMIALGALGTGLAYVLNYRLIRDEGTSASIVSYLLPIVAVLLGAIVLNEAITLRTTTGMLVTLAGVALSRRQPAAGHAP
jgi:drug/metabolite transporter (DMT)-like permease